MPTDKDRAALALESAEDAEHEQDERQLYLKHGRTLAVGADGLDEVIEIRASSGQVELRVVMTEDGPVLRLDGVKLAVTAADAIEMKCKTFSVHASDAVAMSSDGDVEVTSEGETRIRASKDVRVVGEKIFLN